MEAKRTWKQRILQEMKNLAVIFIYLWVFLTAFQLHRGLILSEHKIPHTYAQGLLFALINAWVLAKFVLIAENLPISKRWHSKPLVYSILLKSAVCCVVLVVCRLVEGVASRMWRAKSFTAGIPEMNVANVIDGFSYTVIVFIVLFPFFTAREFRRILGKDVLEAVLLRREDTITLPSVPSRESPA